MISELALQNQIREEACKKGGRLWRNNIGAIYSEDGRFIRYGLANDSAAMNKSIKSADLVGIMPILITPAHVGTIIGRFVCREIKNSNWKYQGNPHDIAQLAWADLINSLGGDAAFANEVGTL